MNKFLFHIPLIKRNCIVFYLFLGLFDSYDAQTVYISPSNDTALCVNETVLLTANFADSVLVLTEFSDGFFGYDISDIPFGTEDGLGTPVILSDDQNSDFLPIGFSFNFYGTNYTEFRISANGWIGFIAPLTGYFNMDLETMDANKCSNMYPNTGILGVLNDFNPGNIGNRIRYQTIGNAPNRKLIVSYNSIPFFFFFCTSYATFQIQLSETSNIIEVHIANKPACDQWANSFRTGVCGPIPNPCSETSPICSFYGYSGTNVEMNNVAWRYTPQLIGPNLNATYSSHYWSINGVINSSGTNINASLPSQNQQQRQYVLTVNYDIPCFRNYLLRDTVTIKRKSFNPAFSVNETVCVDETNLVTFTGFIDSTNTFEINWDFDGGVAFPGSGLGPHELTYSQEGLKDVRLSISSNLCDLLTFSYFIQVDSCGTISIEKLSSPLTLNTYPNPTSDRLTINLSNSLEYQPMRKIEIFNMMGQLIYEASSSSHEINLSLKSENLPSGILQVKIIDTNNNAFQARVLYEK